MDLMVYQKETVRQPQGDMEVLVPGVIDIHPVFTQDGMTLEVTDNNLSNAEIIEGQEEVKQALAMATIFQRGLDPVDIEDGIDWGEVMRQEASPPQLISQLQAKVATVSDTASISFTTITDKNGNERLAFTIKAI